MYKGNDFHQIQRDMGRLVTVAVTDDHPVVRQGLEALLRAHPGVDLVGAFNNGLSALSFVGTTPPDILFLDISMPVMDGITALGLIQQRKLPTYVIAWTANEEARLVREMVQRGANGYLFKGVHEKEIFEAMATVLQNQRYIPPEAARLLRVAQARKSRDSLSRRECEVLCLIADGLSSTEIAERLRLSSRTVDGHRRSLSKRLGIHNVALLTRYAIAEGLVSLD